MLITIYDKTGNPKGQLSPDDSSTQVKEIQGDSVLTLSFTLYDHIILDVDDYIDFEGERYWLTENYQPKQNSRKEWVYDVKMYGVESMLKRLLVIKTVDGEEVPEFTLTAPPREHVAMIVTCMNNGLGNITDWKVGQVTGTENIVVDYYGKYCDEALKEIAEKVGAEAWVEGTTVNICRCEHGEPIPMGYDKGLLSIDPGTADNVKFYTRLYPVGSSRNIDQEKYGHARLQLPGGARYVEINADKYGRVDHYEADAFADIYPRRTGTVTSVRSEEKIGEDGNPFTIYYFMDDDLPFDPNEYEIGGLVKRVSFQEGSELAGLGEEENGTYYFEVNFDSKTKEFEIITIWPYGDEMQLPGAKLVPKVGDRYILWNLRMPDEYYALAEKEFLSSVEKYNQEHWLDIAVYKAPTDHVWIEDNDIVLRIGQRVRLESREYFLGTGYRDSRITRITRKVNLPSQMDIEISDALSKSSQQKISDGVREVREYAKSIGESISLPDIIRTGDRTRWTDNNLLSARRSEEEFVSKKKADRTPHPLAVGGMFEAEAGLHAGNFVAGFSGAGVDEQGNAEVESIVVRSYMKVFELIYNRLNALEGNTSFADSGTIEAIISRDGDTCTALMRKRWEGDFTAFQEGDIVYGYVNDLRKENGGTNLDYYKAWAYVTAVDREANTLTLARYADADVPAGKNFDTRANMLISRWGNITDKSRQSSFYISCEDGNLVELMGVDSPILREGNYGTILGRLPDGFAAQLGIDGLINPDQPYLYARGIVVQDLIRVNYQGLRIRTPQWRGEWNAATAASDTDYYRITDDTEDWVTLDGSLYRYISGEQSALRPDEDPQHWVALTGRLSAMWEIVPSVNTIHIAADGYSTDLVECTIRCNSMAGVEDITTPERLDTFGLELVFSLDGISYNEFWVRDGAEIEGTGLLVGGNNVPWIEVLDNIMLDLREKATGKTLHRKYIPVTRDGTDGGDGTPGKDGGYTEFRYRAIRGYDLAASDYPADGDREPAGWSKTHGGVKYGEESLWQTSAVINGDGTMLTGQWSTPVMLTGRPGAAGVGKRGPVVYPAGIFNADTIYTADESKRPVVQDGELNGVAQYYALRIGKSPYYAGDAPAGRKSPAEDWNTGGDTYWEKFDGFSLLFADILMADFAKLNAAVFWNNLMISQHGTDVFGNQVTDPGAYRDITTGDFIPNLAIDFLNGRIEAQGGSIKGSLEVDHLCVKTQPAASDLMDGVVAYDCSRIGLPEVPEGKSREFRIFNPSRTRTAADLEIECSTDRVGVILAGQQDRRTGAFVITGAGANSNYSHMLLGIGYSNRTDWHITRSKIDPFGDDELIHN